MKKHFFILFLFTLTLPLHASDAGQNPDMEAARAYLLQRVDTWQQSLRTLGVDADPARFDRLRQDIGMLGSTQLSLVAEAMPDAGITEPGPDAIEFPNPEIPPACTTIDPEATYAAFLAAAGLDGILALAKWACLQTVAGENTAIACSAVSVGRAIADFLFQGGQLCLAVQRTATQTATFETQKNVAEHLNQFIDSKVSSRASQASLDTLQSDVTSELQALDSLAASLASDLSDLGGNLTQVSTDIASLDSASLDMASVSEDIRLKTLAMNAELEEADDLAADTQETLEIIRDHSQQTRASLAMLADLIDGLSMAAQTHVDRELDASLGRAMADPDFNIVRYKLPASMDGELERSRELLVRTMVAFDHIGVDTTAAKQLLAMGDTQFNAGRYLSAYANFSQAYQSLVGQPNSPGRNR